MVITQWLCVLMYAFYLNKYGYKLNLKEVALPPVLALLVMSAITVALSGLGINVFLIVAIDMVVYLLIVLPLGLKRDDTRAHNERFQRQRNNGYPVPGTLEVSWKIKKI